MISAAGIVCLARMRRARDCLATRPVTAEIRGRTIGYGVNVPWMPLGLTGTSSPPWAPCCSAVTGGCGPSARC
ncbi:DUF6629 family protein [Streptomyces virginiae]|uniref:DUF6629 family protein n=1 Tax=Streptomyces virginiae TaxID=1961 RepID=UPI00386B68E2